MTTRDYFSTSHDVALPGSLLLDGMWRSPDLCHQIGTLDKQTGRFRNLPVSDTADAIAQSLRQSSEDIEVFFACAEYLTPDCRTAANAVGACAFWCDIDCSECKAAVGKGYPTLEAAEDALRDFCQDTGLPKPTHVVNSGGGFHIYWLLNEVISRDTWRSYAMKHKELTNAYGFLADDSRTADIASVLRVPGTVNYKYSPPRPVTLVYASNEYIERAVMLDAIDRAHDGLCDAASSKSPGRPSTVSTTTLSSAKPIGNSDGSVYGPLDLMKLASALAALDPDCDEETWKLRRLAPLADAARNNPDVGAELYEIARLWSGGELTGYPSTAWTTPGGNGLTGEEAFDGVWHRFLNSKYPGVPITLGTIYFDAMQEGWADMTRSGFDRQDHIRIVAVDAEGGA